MHKKYLQLNDELFDYVCAHRSGADDSVLDALRNETATLGDDARMQISEEQGSFLTILTAALGVTNAIEVGTFTGYSSICIARGLRDGGRLICLDESLEWTGIAKRYWEQAGVTERIDLRIGDAVASLKALEAKDEFDLVFIDAAKEDYGEYYELLLPRVRSNGVILFDNMLWGGSVLESPPTDASTAAVQALNSRLADDSRVECVLLPIADGLQLCRKR